MFNGKTIFKKFAVLGLTMFIPAMMSTPVMAATNNDTNIDDYTISETVVDTDLGTSTEGGIQSRWLTYGPVTRYPAQGGTWTYGFGNAKVRSYYTVNRSHGSTVKLNNKESRSIDTAAGKESIAELWAIQSDSNDSYYYRVN